MEIHCAKILLTNTVPHVKLHNHSVFLPCIQFSGANARADSVTVLFVQLLSECYYRNEDISQKYTSHSEKHRAFVYFLKMTPPICFQQSRTSLGKWATFCVGVGRRRLEMCAIISRHPCSGMYTLRPGEHHCSIWSLSVSNFYCSMYLIEVPSGLKFKTPNLKCRTPK